MHLGRHLGRPLPALVVTATLLAGCGGTEDADDPAPVEDTGTQALGITATTTDGTVVEFEDFSVTCRDSEDGQPPARIVVATSGFDDAENPTEPEGPALFITAADTAGGTTVELPHAEEYGSEKDFVAFFLTEAGEGSELSELSASEKQSDGTIEIVDASCDPTPQLELRIDGRLASETSDGTVEVTGHIKAD